MTECRFIPPAADRLVQPHRPNSLVRSDPADRVKGANRLCPALNLRQTLWWNVETTVFNPHSSASTTVSGPTDSPLSP